MKKIITLFLTLTLMLSCITPAFAYDRKRINELAAEAEEIGTQQGLEGDDLGKFIDEYIAERVPDYQSGYGDEDEDEESYAPSEQNTSYQQKLTQYNEWKEQYDIYSYNSIVVGQDVGYIQDRHILGDNVLKAIEGKPYSNDDAYLIKPGYDCITDITLDGYLLTATFDGEYSLFSLATKDYVITYDKKYDLSCNSIFNLLDFPYKKVYDVTDNENLRLLEDCKSLPAKDTTTGKYGFLNWRTGEIEIPFIYDGVTDFYEGVAAVKKDGKWGYIDENNNTVLEFNYNIAHGFYKGIAQVDTSFINKSGAVLVTSGCDNLRLLGSDYYFGFGDYAATSTSTPEFYKMDIFNMQGEKLYETTITGDGSYNTQDISGFTYLGNGKLKYNHLGKEVVLDIPQTPISKTTATSVFNSNDSGKFTDVPETTWYHDAVYKVKDLGIIAGKGNGLFDPNGNLTVAEGITLAARVRANYNKEELPSVSGEWYAGALEYAVKQGILKNGDFTDFNKKITRAEMAYLFSNALPSTEYNSINQITALPDVSANTKYQANIFKLYNAGIVSGSDKYGTFNPNSNIQRSETAAIILRVVDKSERKTLSLETLPVENQGTVQTWNEGETHSEPKVGDIVIKADGTKVVLKTTKVGDCDILAYGQGVDCITGTTINGNIRTASNLGGAWSGFNNSDLTPFIKDPITGEVHTEYEWGVISLTTQPKSPGSYNGEIQNTYFEWDSNDNYWYWTGPSYGHK